MRSFAFCQVLRASGMTATILYVCLSESQNYLQLTFCFLVGEVLVLGFCLARNLGLILPPSPKWKGWISKHLSFGLRSFGAGVFVELNTRVDVLVIGFFLSDHAVGVYTYGAIFAEGFMQFIVIKRNILNPFIGKHLMKKDRSEFRKWLPTQQVRVILIMAVLFVVCLIAEEGIRYFFLDPQVFAGGAQVFLILSLSMLAVSWVISFDGTLIQAGFPGTHTLTILGATFSNFLLNLMMVPWLGIMGAAFATAISVILGAALMVYLVRRRVNLSLIPGLN